MKDDYSEWSKADLVKHIFSLQQENKRLEEENEQIENDLNALTNLYGIRVNRHDDTESELQQTKAQLEECLNVLDMVKQSTNDFGLIGDINKLLTNIK